MNTKNPYKGLFPYTAKDEKLFFGRDKESFDLVEMIKNNQLVIIYGESGTGKTSLINAKLFPELKRQYYFPIYIRLNYTSKVDPLTQLRQIIDAELRKWDKSVPLFTPDLTLIEYAAKTSVFNGLVKPILFFDQFEELFTLGPKHVESVLLDALIEQLSDLIEVRLPKLHKKHQLISASSNNDEYLNEETCTENVLRFTVVFSLRQDYIAQLDDLRFKIPSVSANRYRIKKFAHSQAFDAIIKPAEEFAKTLENSEKSFSILNKETTHEVINQLIKLEFSKVNNVFVTKERLPNILTQKNIFKGIFIAFINLFKRSDEESRDIADQMNLNNDYFNKIEIDPTILSLYCYQLYEEAKSEIHKFPQISLEQVHKSPCDEIIKNYYNASLVKRKDKYGIESLLITPDGRRVLMSLKDFLFKSKMSEEEVENLKSKTAILRIYGEDKEREVELAHDQIARRALISKKAREANVIKRNGLVFLLTASIIVVLVVGILVIYVKEREKQVNIQYLQSEVSTLTEQKNKFTKDIDELENKYNAVLVNRNALITNMDEVNKQINLVSDQLKTEVNKNNTLTKSLSLAKQQNQQLISKMSNQQIKYESQGDLSIESYKKNLAQQTTELNNYKKRISTLENENKQLRSEITLMANKNKNIPTPSNKYPKQTQQQK